MMRPSLVAVIEALSKQQSPLPENWQDLEDHVQYVYQTLLTVNEKDVIVARNVDIIGGRGQAHQIDVYYQFEVAGIQHRVAIECKNTKRQVDKDRVSAFVAKVNDCPGLRGLIISVAGYQAGAKKFAEDNGVAAIKFEELPSVGALLGIRLGYSAIPSKDSVGQPFWAIFEDETGAPLRHTQDGKHYGLLFLSKRVAREHWEVMAGREKWSVRGMSQNNLRAFILTVDAMNGGYLLVHQVASKVDNVGASGQLMDRNFLIEEFYHGAAAIPKEPEVMPAFKGKRTPK